MNSKLISIHTIYQIVDNTISSRFMCKTLKVQQQMMIQMIQMMKQTNELTYCYKNSTISILKILEYAMVLDRQRTGPHRSWTRS